MDLTLTPEDEFFVMLCERKYHSFIGIGVKQPGLAPFFLLGLGKQAPRINCPTGLLRIGKGVLGFESTLFQGERLKDLRYKAFAITFQQYLLFLDYLTQLSDRDEQENLFRVDLYIPMGPTMKMVWLMQYLPKTAPACGKEEQALGRMSIFNNCRHSAVHLAKKASQRPDLGRSASTNFFIKPPLRGIVRRGEEHSDYFFILPLPPTAYEKASPEKRKILEKLYHRMDSLILIAQDHAATAEKFRALKFLYNDLAGSAPLSLQEILTGIQRWAEQNKTLIGTHRRSHWFSFPTATQKMVDALLKPLQSVQSEVAPVVEMVL